MQQADQPEARNCPQVSHPSSRPHCHPRPALAGSQSCSWCPAPAGWRGPSHNPALNYMEPLCFPNVLKLKQTSRLDLTSMFVSSSSNPTKIWGAQTLCGCWTGLLLTVSGPYEECATRLGREATDVFQLPCHNIKTSKVLSNHQQFRL